MVRAEYKDNQSARGYVLTLTVVHSMGVERNSRNELKQVKQGL